MKEKHTPDLAALKTKSGSGRTIFQAPIPFAFASKLSLHKVTGLRVIRKEKLQIESLKYSLQKP